MNILLINASPRKERSNTLRLARAFVDGVKEEAAEQGQEVDVREVVVADLDVKSCRGCFACWKSSAGKCVIHDDVAWFLESRLWANMVVWSFPLYYFSVPGQLKVLIDRQLPLLMPQITSRDDGVGDSKHEVRYDLSSQQQVAVSTCGFYTAEGNYDGVASLFNHLCENGAWEAIFCGQGELFHIPDPHVTERVASYLEAVKQAGREYQRGGITEQTRSKLGELLIPRDIFERMANSSWSKG